jgi:hypothetical protein
LLLCDVDAPVRLSAEAVGRARDFIRRVQAEDAQFLRGYAALLRPVKPATPAIPGESCVPRC